MPRSLRLPLLAVALAAVLTGCTGAGGASSSDRSISVALAGTPEMNSGGNAVVLRVYQLTAEVPFTLVPLEEFWVDDAASLDGTLVSKREVLLYPEEVRPLPIELNARTTHIGVAADFRSPSLDDWRAVFPASLVVAEGLGVLVGNDALVVTGPTPSAAPPAQDSTGQR